MLWQIFAREVDLFVPAPAPSIPWYIVPIAFVGVLTLTVLVVLFFGRSRRPHD